MPGWVPCILRGSGRRTQSWFSTPPPDQANPHTIHEHADQPPDGDDQARLDEGMSDPFLKRCQVHKDLRYEGYLERPR